ncbi:protein LAZ1 homolog 2 isoform X2 [Ricinus communis]|uniref:protein LAZ1 homolog 2 isoform X2 n=1 Tax=Ricinus communis TaxID=3988 RepID=UPI0007721BC1|nr:protein LAZ1 homolog 2 isoform X2 [Ricinus communis]|eukprot:XP_015572877.1 protein LAZ1 homolog 2 isoform X2 [Ricinus communis]
MLCTCSCSALNFPHFPTSQIIYQPCGTKMDRSSSFHGSCLCYRVRKIISLWNHKFSLVCDILRNCYEAFALYAFGSYLVACLGGEKRVIELLENEAQKRLSQTLLEELDENQGVHQRSFMNFFCRPYIIGRDAFTIEKFGLVQYMILKTLCAFLAFLLELFGVYGDGEFKWYYGYPYIAVVLNFSQMWALYCLLHFYNIMHERLRPIKPLSKFISFKAIVFATWWQGVDIALLCASDILPNEGKFRTGLQDFLICIEMAIAAVAHVFVFSVEPYHYVPASAYGRVANETAKVDLKVEEGDEEKPAVLEKTEPQVEAPGTSVTESVQDIVLQGGQSVVKDVVLTINQAIGPVEKGVTKIQETFHWRSGGSEDKEDSELKVEEQLEKTGMPNFEERR